MDDRLKKLVDKSIDCITGQCTELLTSESYITDEYLDEAFEVSAFVSKRDVLDAVRSSKNLNRAMKYIIEDTADSIYRGIKASKKEMQYVLEERRRDAEQEARYKQQEKARKEEAKRIGQERVQKLMALGALKNTLTPAQRKLFKKANIKI